ERAWLGAVAEGEFRAAQLRRLAESRLPAYMVPSFFTVLPALPLTPSGKIDRKALLGYAIEIASEEPLSPSSPLSLVEELVAGIFAEVLQLERVDARTSFFALG